MCHLATPATAETCEPDGTGQDMEVELWLPSAEVVIPWERHERRRDPTPGGELPHTCEARRCDGARVACRTQWPPLAGKPGLRLVGAAA